MVARTSPRLIVRATPLRISRPLVALTRARRFLISSRAIGPLSVVGNPLYQTSRAVAGPHRSLNATDNGPLTTDTPSPNAPLQTYAEQLLRLNRELHRQLAEHVLAEPVHDHVHRVFQ